ncbi:MAG: hypothetical protein NZM10_06720, partial [Fimbriimonadales bacterium]|nr:hypothetical protein [Fimbriimonadales bacterium]
DAYDRHDSFLVSSAGRRRYAGRVRRVVGRTPTLRRACSSCRRRDADATQGVFVVSSAGRRRYAGCVRSVSVSLTNRVA